jgi:hypothetical protein
VGSIEVQSLEAIGNAEFSFLMKCSAYKSDTVVKCMVIPVFGCLFMAFTRVSK